MVRPKINIIAAKVYILYLLTDLPVLNIDINIDVAIFRQYRIEYGYILSKSKKMISKHHCYRLISRG